MFWHLECLNLILDLNDVYMSNVLNCNPFLADCQVSSLSVIARQPYSSISVLINNTTVMSCII